MRTLLSARYRPVCVYQLYNSTIVILQEKSKAEDINVEARRKLEDFKVPDVREQHMIIM